MEPKDLKNSEELKSTAQSDTDKPKKKVNSKNKEVVDNEKENKKSKKSTASKSKKEPPGSLEKNTAETGKKTGIEVATIENKTVKTEEKEEISDKLAEKKIETKGASEGKETETVSDSVAFEKVENQEVTREGKSLENELERTVKKKRIQKTKNQDKKEDKPEVDNEIKPTHEVVAETILKEPVISDVEKEEKAEIADQKVEQKIKKEKRESVDYSKYSQLELVNVLRDVMDNHGDYEDLKGEIDIIKSTFYKKQSEYIEQVKKEFIEEGGIEEEFEAEEDPYENDIKDLLGRYKQIRIELNRQFDKEKEENLKKKYEVIEKIKGLINNEESINKTFNEFRDLQREWREIGLVPQSKMKNLWDLYHFHVENFYDYIKINRELRDLDLKRNLEAKINLCEEAEELLMEMSTIKAFNLLQKYHEQWREIGPVPRENKDDIWERFKTITAKINKKHQEFFENRKDDQKKNLDAKTALCEKVEEINSTEMENYKEWDEKSKELIELQKVWRTIGFAPKKDNNKIYDRFRAACDDFFNRKREFYAMNKELQQNNLQMKIDLCVQAESLKDSTDWKKTTQDLINIQKQWKEIGPVPRKHSDIVWKRFRAACDSFFDKKSEHFSDVDSEQVDNLKLKEDLINEVINFNSKGNAEENLKSLKEFQRRWTEIGHVPFKKKDDLQNRFREAINKLYDVLNIDEEKRNLLKFKSKMASFAESNRGQNKMRMEREKYMNKLKQLENDLVLLDNNIGFFAKSKNAESLIADVKNKIEDTKQRIETLKEKIRLIDDLDN